jgi:hypothetical protein
MRRLGCRRGGGGGGAPGRERLLNVVEPQTTGPENLKRCVKGRGGGGVVVNMRWGCRVTPGELLSRVKPLLRRTSSTSRTLSLLATACSSSSSYLKMSCFKPLWRDMAAIDMLLCRRGAVFERAELAMHMHAYATGGAAAATIAQGRMTKRRRKLS